MGAPALAPEAAGVDIAAGFALICQITAAIGISWLYSLTLGSVLQAVARAGKLGVWKVHINVGSVAEKLDNRIRHNLGAWVLENEQLLGAWWHANKKVAEWTYDGIVDFGKAVHNSIAGVVYGEIPTQVQARTKPLTGRIGRVDHRARARDREQAKATARGIAAEHDYVTGRAKVAERGIDAIRSTIRTNVIPRVRANERAIAAERKYTHKGVAGRLSRLERWLGAGVIGGAAVAAITRVFPYWQCSNVKRFNRNVCRSPLGSLDWLFGLAATAVVALDLEEVVHEGTDVANALTGIWEQMIE